MSLVHNRLRNLALDTYQFRSTQDMFAYTEYMLMCSDMLRAVSVDNGPEIFIPETIVDLSDVFAPFQVTPANARVLFELVSYPFSRFEWSLIETFARDFAHARLPVIQWLWEEGILPQLYHLLRVSWPSTRLTAEQVITMAFQLRDAMFLNAWPDSYLESAQECSLCFETCITAKHALKCCGKWCCWDCALTWMRRSDSCPFCRQDMIDIH